MGRARYEHNDAAGTNMGRESQKGGDGFARMQKLESDDQRIEWFSGNEGLEVGGHKSRPVALTGYRCASLRQIDRFRRRVYPHDQSGRTDQLRQQETGLASTNRVLRRLHALFCEIASRTRDIFDRPSRSGCYRWVRLYIHPPPFYCYFSIAIFVTIYCIIPFYASFAVSTFPCFDVAEMWWKPAEMWTPFAGHSLAACPVM